MQKYRKTTILSTALKVSVGIVEAEITEKIENKLEEPQGGFRKGKEGKVHAFFFFSRRIGIT